ncbi:MAG: PilZ domain-containing protein [Magnetococcales bacterium]|nr:PilZ domain-containing protein [Magnetococcales bacterium]
MLDEHERTVSTTSRRQHERVWFRFQVELVLDGKVVLLGTTKDVSLRGMFIHTTHPPCQVAVGDTGTLRLSVLNLKREFPCRVVHVQSTGLGLTFQPHGDDLGTILDQVQIKTANEWIQ